MARPWGYAVILLLLLLNALQPLPASDRSEFLKEFSGLVILENGRKKPLDTFARQSLGLISGKTDFAGQSAGLWLARVLFTPEQTYADDVFRISSPQVQQALGLGGAPGNMFSFARLYDSLDNLQRLARQAGGLEEKQRSKTDNEIIRLYYHILLYDQLIHSLQWAIPQKELISLEPQLRQQLGLPATTNELSYLDFSDKMVTVRALHDSLSADEKSIRELEQNLTQLAETGKNPLLAIIPPPVSAGEETNWLSPWEAVAPDQPSGGIFKKELSVLSEAVLSFRRGDLRKAGERLHDLRLLLNRRNRINSQRINLEILYNRVEPFTWALRLYGMAFLLILISLLWAQRILYRLSLILMIPGFLLQTTGLAARLLITARPPVTNLYETFVFVSWVAALLGLVLEWLQKRRLGVIAGGFAAVLLLTISGRYALEGDTMGMLVAVLNTNLWLAVHVATVTVGYAGCVVAGVIGHVYILQQLVHRDEETLAGTYRSLYAILAFGLVFTFLGTVMGGIWADQSWGRFWGWDPKENGALLIILWLAILFHARLAGWIGRMGLAAGAVVSLLTVMLAWFGVNLLGIGLHTYGLISGVNRALIVFFIFELLFLAASGLLYRNRPRP